jgi:hypothetical protein
MRGRGRRGGRRRGRALLPQLLAFVANALGSGLTLKSPEQQEERKGERRRKHVRKREEGKEEKRQHRETTHRLLFSFLL